MNTREDKVRTGIEGLDEVLLGGINRFNNVLIEGAAGAGKTTLGLGFIHAGAALFDEPGVIVSFELEPSKILRDARGFNWDLQGLIDRGKLKILNASPAALIREFRADDSVLMEHLRALGARRLMIDGLTPLKLYAEANQLPFREDLHALIEGLTAQGITTLVTAERDGKAHDANHERYVFDTVISMTRHSDRRRESRKIKVEKSRGQDFIGGTHTLEIRSGHGILVYRRAQSRPKVAPSQPTSTIRISSGVPVLDEMLGGGLYEGSITLVNGISGTGKTVAGMQFLQDSARTGKRGLLVSLDEHPAQLLRNARSLGIDLQPLIDAGMIYIHYESPLELDLDVHYDRIIRLVEEKKIDCIVFDSVAVYEMSSPEEAADYLYALATFCKNRLATVYFNYESPELLGVSQISEELKASHLVDNILLLSYVEISTRLRRAITVPKVRGSRNLQITREYVIREGGISIVVDESVVDAPATVPQLPFSSYYSLLARSPSRKSPVIEEAINQGEALPPDVAVPVEGG